MGSLKYKVIRAAFEGLSLSPLPALIRRGSSCRGVIFTLHRVLPEAPREFSPNAILQVTPDFLAAAIDRVRRLGMEIVSLDEAVRRIQAHEAGKPFVVFTFDDAYRDNLVHALPVLKAKQCPFTLYVPTALVDGTGEVWWQALEDIIADRDSVTVGTGTAKTSFETATLASKQAAYDALYWEMRKMPEPDRVVLIHELAAAHDFDLVRHCRDLVMTWSELETFFDEPLCTIGAHTVRHYELAKLPAEEARQEIEQSVAILASRAGRAPEHLSYPIGGPASAGEREFALARELGFDSAVTTRPGGIYHHHKDDLTALPRISLNGLFQKPRYLDVFATGAIFTGMARAGF